MKRLLLAIAAAAALAARADAAVVGFDSFDQQGATVAAGGSFTAAGFTFTQLSDAPSILVAGEFAGVTASNGTPSLYAANDARFVVAGGGLFDLVDFEIGGGNLAFLDPANAGLVAPWATSLTLTAFFDDGTSVSKTIAIDPAASGLARVNADVFDAVAVQFSASGDYTVDNLTLLLAVPEPPALALALLAIALGAAAGLRGRRRTR